LPTKVAGVTENGNIPKFPRTRRISPQTGVEGSWSSLSEAAIQGARVISWMAIVLSPLLEQLCPPRTIRSQNWRAVCAEMVRAMGHSSGDCKK